MITFYLVCKNSSHNTSGDEVSIPIEIDMPYSQGLKLLRGLEEKTRQFADIGKIDWVQEEKLLKILGENNG